MTVYASPAEVLKAFEALSEADQFKLEAFGRALMRSQKLSPYEKAEELIRESLHRALEGARRWPAHVDFRAFLAETMRSVINHDTDNMDDKPGAHTRFDATLVEAHHWSMGVHAPSAEDEFAAHERRFARIAALDAADRALEAEGDELARHVLRGMVQELSQRELAERTNAGPKQLEAARKRAQRRLRDAFGQSSALH